MGRLKVAIIGDPITVSVDRVISTRAYVDRIAHAITIRVIWIVIWAGVAEVGHTVVVGIYRVISSGANIVCVTYLVPISVDERTQTGSGGVPLAGVPRRAVIPVVAWCGDTGSVVHAPRVRVAHVQRTFVTIVARGVNRGVVAAHPLAALVRCAIDAIRAIRLIPNRSALSPTRPGALSAPERISR